MIHFFKAKYFNRVTLGQHGISPPIEEKAAFLANQAIAPLETYIDAITAACGHPDPAEGCRIILQHVSKLKEWLRVE